MNIPELSRPTETSDFTIGGVKINVPVMSFGDLEQLQLKLTDVRAGMPQVEYARLILEIVAYQLTENRESLDSPETKEIFARLQRACSIPEMRNLDEAFSRFLQASGLVAPSGEELAATPENPGTGTSTASSQILPSGESVAETQGASNLH